MTLIKKIIRKVGDHVRTWKYKNIFAKGYVPNCGLNKEYFVVRFYKKELQTTNQKEFKAEKVIKRKGDKLYVKSKGYGNSFNSWINKKDIAYMIEYCPNPKSLGANVKVELDLSNYATKADLKNAICVDKSGLVKKLI